MFSCGGWWWWFKPTRFSCHCFFFFVTAFLCARVRCVAYFNERLKTEHKKETLALLFLSFSLLSSSSWQGKTQGTSTPKAKATLCRSHSLWSLVFQAARASPALSLPFSLSRFLSLSLSLSLSFSSSSYIFYSARLSEREREREREKERETEREEREKRERREEISYYYFVFFFFLPLLPFLSSSPHFDREVKKFGIPLLLS